VTPDGAAVLYAAARWLGYLAAFILIGAVALRHLVLPRAGAGPAAEIAAARALAGVAAPAGLLLVSAHFSRLYLQARSLLDPGEPVSLEFLRLVVDTPWGQGWVVQLATAASATAAWVAVRAAPARRAGAWLAAIAAAGIALAAPYTGHAAALPRAGRIGPALDALHFGAGAVWLGTLALVVWLALRRPDPALRPAPLVAAFSPVALTAGLVTMAAGALMGWRYMEGIAPLWTTAWGRALSLKLAVLAGAAGLGAWNWRVVLPRLRATGDPAALRRTARLEIALGALLLGVTAALVALPAPGEE
jgi:putative copper export protein